MAELPPLPQGFTLDQPQPAPQMGAGPVTIGTPKPKFAQLTPEEVAGMGLPPGNYQRGPDGKVEQIGGTNQKSQPSYDDLTKLNQRGDAIRLLNKRIGDIAAQYQQNFAGQGPGAIVEYAPGFVRPENANFDAAANALMGDIASAQGLTAQQQNTPTELQIRFGPFIPKASDRDEVIVGKIQRLRDIVQSQLGQINAQRQALGLPPVSLEEQQQAPPAMGGPQGGQAMAAPSAQPPGMPPGGGSPVASPDLATVYEGSNGETGNAMAPATEYVRQDDPALAGVKGEYLRRLAGGASVGELVSFVKDAGVPINAGLVKSIADQVQFRRQHPDVLMSNYDVSQLDDTFVPTTAYQKTMNAAAGTSLGAGAIAAGDAASMGTLDNVVGMTGGSAEQARIAIDDASRQHPVASGVGTLVGGTSAALAGEAGLARLGVGAGAARGLAADTAYGAGYGAGSADEGNRTLGALYGGAAGLGGSAVGRTAAHAAGAGVSPTGGRLADLYEAGVRPTPGQRFANSGVAGRLLNAVEEQLGSVPVVGSAIRGARQNARDQFQVGAFNSALGDIGEQLPRGVGPGTAAHAYTERAFRRVYDQARTGMQILPDQELGTDIAAVRNQVNNLAEPSQRRFEQIIQNVVMRRAGATVDGAAYKDMQSELGKVIRGIRKSPQGDGELADVLGDLRGALDSAARRHSNPDAVQLLDNADRGYAKFVQIENASARGGVGKGAGSFSPNDFAASVKGNGTRVRSKAYNQGQGLMQGYAEAGQNLTDRVPNSGSPERILAASALTGGAQMYEPHTLGVLGLIGALYAPGVRRVTTGALAPKGQAARALANQIRSRARIAGHAGAAIAVNE